MKNLNLLFVFGFLLIGIFSINEVKAQTQPFVYDTTICGIANVTMIAEGGDVGEIYKWYDSSVGTNIIHTDTVKSVGMKSYYTIPNLSTTTVFFVSLDSLGSESNRYMATATVFDKALISFSTITAATCGNSDGSATCVPTGGTPPYSYYWNSGGVSATEINLSSGFHRVTVTDANYCESIDSVAITNTGGPSASIDYQTNVSCFGGNDGNASLIVFGGTFPYSYIWNTGETSNTASNLTAGEYNVIVTDNSLCSQIVYVTITEPSELSISKISTNVTCFGFASGIIDITPSGGVGPYSYSWSNSSSMQDVGGLVAGTYKLTLTDGNLCTITDSTIITQPTSALSLNLTPINISCNGASDGSITSVVLGGTPPYTYNWSNTLTSSNITSLVAGTYTLTVVDANSCNKISSTNVIEPTQIVVNAGTDQNICYGYNVSISAYATGGTPSYTYFWSPSTSLDNSNIQNPLASPISTTTYTLVVSDMNYCTGKDSVIISVIPQTIVNAGADQYVPNATSSVSLAGTISGNTTTGIWTTDGDGTFSPDPTTLNAVYIFGTSDIALGTVTCTLTSTNNGTCLESADGIFITILSAGNNKPVAKDDYITITENSSNNLIDVLANDFDPDVSNLTVSILNIPLNGTADLIGDSIYYSPNSSFVGNDTIVYQISDAALFDTAKVFIVVKPLNLCNISSNAIVNHPKCFGASDGSISIAPSGGQSPYSYIWSNVSTSSILDNLAAGLYTVTITDALGCELIDPISLTQPSMIFPTIGVQSPTCNGFSDGVINIDATGGIGPYTYQWSNDSVGNVIYGLKAGLYNVTIFDSNMCQRIKSINITEPTEVSGTLTHKNPKCNGSSDGEATVLATGGTPPYSYLWFNDFTGTTQTNLSSGQYSVAVSDSNNCSISNTVILTNPKMLSDTILTIKLASCDGAANGLAIVSGIGGTAPYSYLWDNGQTDNKAINLLSGSYFFTITDVNSCEHSNKLTIPELGKSKLQGIVKYSKGIIRENDAKVFLLKASIPPFKEVKHIAVDLNGKFLFDSLVQGKYYLNVKINKDSLDEYPRVMQTYYDKTHKWQNATLIDLNCETVDSVIFVMSELPALESGNGIIKGNVNYALNGNKSIKGEPVPGAEIAVEQEPDDMPIMQSTTREDGSYAFTNVPTGVYSLSIDIPGIPQMSTHNVILSDNDLTYEGMNFIVDTGSTTLGITTDSVNSVPFVLDENIQISIYPNPASETLTIDYKLDKKVDVSFELINIEGKVLNTQKLENSLNENSIKLNVENLENGIYFVKFESGNSIYVKKISIIK